MRGAIQRILTIAGREIVSRRSTRTVLRCAAHGGERGAVVSFALEGAGRLVRVSGGELPEGRFVPPGQRLDFGVVYEGRLPSGSERDIVARATAEDAGTGETSGSTDALTSVQVELRAVYEAPENPNPSRHVYGVGEQVELRHYPTGANIVWLIGGDDFFSELLYDSVGSFDCILKLHYLKMEKVDIVAEIQGVEYCPMILLVEPSCVVCRNCEWDGSCLPKGSAGGVGMNLGLYIGPMNVSFQGIDVSEIPCETVLPATGYYATTNFDGELSHNLNAQAGYWHHVKPGNYWCQDRAWSNVRRPPWSNGRMVWNIPIQWYQKLEDSSSWSRGTVHSDGELIGGMEDAYLQEFDILQEGKVRVKKHGHTVERTVNDIVHLDGEMVHFGVH